MKKGTILVTPRSLSEGGHPALAPLEEAGYQIVYPAPGRQPSEKELIAVIGEAVGYLAGVELISAAVIEAAGHLKVISRNGVGADNINGAAVKKADIKVVRAVGANSRGVAELTMGCMLAAARAIPAADAVLKTRAWKREKGFELQDKTLGLVGCGQIGRQVADLALAFGMRVIACDPCPVAPISSKNFSFTAFDKVISNSDVISLHCPPKEEGFVIDRQAIASMKKGVILINTARAGLIDEEAVLAALDAGEIRALSNDAFATEPPVDWRLSSHKRVIATPHIGGFTTESIDRATAAAVDNLLTGLES